MVSVLEAMRRCPGHGLRQIHLRAIKVFKNLLKYQPNKQLLGLVYEIDYKYTTRKELLKYLVDKNSGKIFFVVRNRLKYENSNTGRLCR